MSTITKNPKQKKSITTQYKLSKDMPFDVRAQEYP